MKNGSIAVDTLASLPDRPVDGASSLNPSGFATAGGIGVLQTIKGAPPGNIDLIAPTGVVDAGEAGIRASGTSVPITPPFRSAGGQIRWR